MKLKRQIFTHKNGLSIRLQLKLAHTASPLYIGPLYIGYSMFGLNFGIPNVKVWEGT